MSFKQTILIVDDDISSILLLENLLKNDYHILTAQNAKDGLSLASSPMQPDLILLDVLMAEQDGYQACIQLKSNRKTKHIPIIFVTAKDEPADEEYGLSIGAVDYIIKPINSVIVFARIKTHLKLKKQTDLLIKNEVFMKATLDNSPLLISTLDLEGRITSVNKQFELLDGREAAAYLGKKRCSLSHENQLTKDTDNITQRLDLVHELEEILEHSDGSKHTYLSINFPIVLPENNIIGSGTISSDITARKSIEQSLRQSKKLEAVGQLTGGIAHDFNNILGVILGNVELLQTNKEFSDKDKKRLESISRAGNRAAYLVNQLLGFSRFKPMKQAITNIEIIIEEMDKLISSSLTEQIEITKRFEDGLWLSLLDPSDLQDAIINLLFNARDAMPNGGQITLELHNCILDSEFCGKNPGATPGEYIQLIVKDTGHGISESNIDNIFNPFFSTKTIGKGSGLGLSMVFGFVKRSAGYIKVISKVDQGSEFQLYFPKIDDTAATKPLKNKPLNLNSNLAEKSFKNGKVTILIVDDEIALLETTKEMLELKGYNILTAINGVDALDVLAKESNITLLISDVIMPGGLNGYQLVEKCKNLYPDIKIMLCSGFSQPQQLEKNIYETEHLLKKPFNLEKLTAKINEVLN